MTGQNGDRQKAVPVSQLMARTPGFHRGRSKHECRARGCPTPVSFHIFHVCGHPRAATPAATPRRPCPRRAGPSHRDPLRSTFRTSCSPADSLRAVLATMFSRPRQRLPLLLATSPWSPPAPPPPPQFCQIQLVWCPSPLPSGPSTVQAPSPLFIFVSGQAEALAVLCSCSICSTRSASSRSPLSKAFPSIRLPADATFPVNIPQQPAGSDPSLPNPPIFSF